MGDDLLNLVLPLFSTPKNYPQMLKHLAGFAFYETYFITLFLRNTPVFGHFCNNIEGIGTFGRLINAFPYTNVINVFGIIVGLLVGLGSYIFHLHDRISDFTKIRASFDLNNILLPMAALASISLTDKQINKFEQERDKTMRKIFYKYTSSTIDNPLVDKHDIQGALGAWTWFWSFTEAIFYFSAGCVVAIWLDALTLSVVFAVVVLLMVTLCFAIYPILKRNAKRQIDVIFDDPNAKLEIQAVLRAL